MKCPFPRRIGQAKKEAQMSEMTWEEVQGLLKKAGLTEREDALVREFFGLTDRLSMIMTPVLKKQIFAKAMRKLRNAREREV